jgi:ribonucleoside-triphosphate reductase
LTALLIEPEVRAQVDDKTDEHQYDGDDLDNYEPINVLKRDGRIVDFDGENIIRAISLAFHDVGKTTTKGQDDQISSIAAEIESTVKERYTQPVHIEDIQNLVEHEIINHGWYDVAKSYTDYRLSRDIKRAKSLDINHEIERFVGKDKTLVNENANKDSRVYSTQRDLLAGTVSRSIALKMLPADVANAHAKGDIHFHDADYSPFTPMTNCSLPNFKDMLANGFMLGNAEMGSPQSIETAATQVTQIMLDVASSQYGGQSFNRADEVLSIYARKNYDKNMEIVKTLMPDGTDPETARKMVVIAKRNENKNLHIPNRATIIDHPDEGIKDPLDRERDLYVKILTRKNIYDAMQTIEYQVNTQHATTGQTPFVTIGFGLGEDWFEREIQRCILLIRINGLGSKHKTAIFPKLTFTIKHGLNDAPGTPNYDMKQLALECTSKRMYPDVLFYENVVKVTGSFKAPMGCRSFLQGWVNPDTGEDEEDGRMNLGVVTVNIPRIAIESHGNRRKFWRIFNQRMEVAHHALQFRIKRTQEALPENAPGLWEHGGFGRLHDGDDVSKLMLRSRATISLGYIGLYETTAMFYGKDWANDYGWDEDAHKFMLSILKKLTKLCKQWEDEEGVHCSVYGTPAESLTDKLARLDKEKFGVIPGITDHDFYTNSFHRPVWIGSEPHEPTASVLEVVNRPHFHYADNGSAASKIDFECECPKYSAGGNIIYVEYPSMRQNLKGLEAMWDYAYEKGVPFLGSNTPIDSCELCGYQGDFAPTSDGYKCPECGNDDPTTVQVVKRVCGYLGEPSARPMVHGRHEEIIHRAKQLEGETGRIADSNGDIDEFYEDRSISIDKTGSDLKY